MATINIDWDPVAVAKAKGTPIAKKLQKQGHFPENIKLESETDFAEHTEDNMIAFEYGDPSASESDDEESSEDINLDDI